MLAVLLCRHGYRYDRAGIASIMERVLNTGGVRSMGNARCDWHAFKSVRSRSRRRRVDVKVGLTRFRHS